jgi:O-antigen/teichoic acid export membrane protein
MIRENLSHRRYAIGTEAVRAGISAVQFLAAARLLGSAEYGVYAQVIALAVILTPISTFAAAAWLQPVLRDRGDTVAQGCVTAITTSLIVLAAPLAVASALLLATFDARMVAPLLLISLAEVAGFASWNVLCLVDLGLGKARAYLIGTTACGFAKMLGTLACFVLGENQLAVLGGVLLFTSVVGYGAHAKSRGYVLSFSIRSMVMHWVDASRRGLVSVVSALFDQADRVVVGFLVPAADLSSYAAAGRISNYSLIPSRGVALAAYPHYFELCNRGKVEDARRLAWRTSFRGVAFGLPVALAAIVGAWLLGETLLEDFPGLLPLVIVLSGFALLRPVHYSFGDLLYALGKPRERLAALSALSVVYIGGVFLVAPRWGVLGTSMYSVASEGLLLVLLIGLVARATSATARQHLGDADGESLDHFANGGEPPGSRRLKR